MEASSSKVCSTADSSYLQMDAIWFYSLNISSYPLHRGIHWPAATFRWFPHNVLQRILDVAGFAVNAVLCIDLQMALCIRDYDFVNPGRAVTLFRRVEFFYADGNGFCFIEQVQVAGLIALMCDIAERDGAKLVEADFSIRIGVVDCRHFRCRTCARVISLLMAQCPGQSHPGSGQPHFNPAKQRTEGSAEMG